ncbi:anthocyanidin 3-O-glucosyltransferase 6-like [Populus alba x Populus x berolinensis]|uniref:Anthocyanidin 3-O-glucosyltransferase 6-like n=1 Tax=Populus alba x Populus x berolinensis TaxID=444605 RepID=A0AAD6LIN4_9ROSI|nr:anthocyanidin 3-O-glucosyltransferase 6-like [Populus alba x Populus x berolinensis]
MCNRIRFIDLPEDELDPNQPNNAFFSLIQTHKPHAKEEVSKLVSQSESSPDSPALAGLVLDMFSTPMIDVTTEIVVPSYIFLTSGAAYLGLVFYIQALHGEQRVDPIEFKDSEAELVMPCLANPYPAKVESHAINSFSNGNTPPMCPEGPILKQWLDDQPLSSVVYICFGSMGSFGVDQVKEIACGLEQSGHRFLWSLRKPPPKGRMELLPSDYTNPRDVLPQGFF